MSPFHWSVPQLSLKSASIFRCPRLVWRKITGFVKWTLENVLNLNLMDLLCPKKRWNYGGLGDMAPNRFTNSRLPYLQMVFTYSIICFPIQFLGKVLDRAHKRVAFRTISLNQSEVDAANSTKGLLFQFEVNGVPIFLKGEIIPGNLIFCFRNKLGADILFSRSWSFPSTTFPFSFNGRGKHEFLEGLGRRHLRAGGILWFGRPIG